MNAQRRPLLIILGILLIGAGFALNILLPRILGTDQGAVAGNVPVTATAPVLVTATPVNAGSAISATNATIAYYPVTLVPADALKALPANTQYVNTALGPHVPITQEMLVPSASAAAALTYVPPKIPAGDVLFPVPYDPTTMSYFIAGDHIDLMATHLDNSVYVALTNIPIERLGNPGEQGATLKPTVMILVVSRADAVTIANLLTGSGGNKFYRWVLRSPDDN